MMNKKTAGLLLLAFLLTACVGTSEPSKFYSLEVVKLSGADYALKQSVGVAEVKIPAYIDKPQMVTRDVGGVELSISEIHRWSEPLSTMLQRVLADDMAADLPKAVVKARSSGREDFTYMVYVDVSRLDGRLGGKVELDAWWSVVNRDDRIMVRRRSVLQNEAGKNYDDLVKNQSLLVAQLAKEIAAALSRLK